MESALGAPQPGGRVAKIAVPELALVQGELYNRRLLGLFSHALAAGGASGSPGSLDTAGLSTVDLDAAIATAAELGVTTDEVDRLLQAAKLVRRLRAVQVCARGVNPKPTGVCMGSESRVSHAPPSEANL